MDEIGEIGEVSRMVGKVGRAHASAAAAMLHDLGLYPGQELLLMRLWEADHQTQAELTASLGLDPSTVTRTVQCLERQGLLHRTPSSTDRRAVIVSLTPAACELRELVQEFWSRLETRTMRDMSQRQRTSAMRLLRRVETNLSPNPSPSPSPKPAPGSGGNS